MRGYGAAPNRGFLAGVARREGHQDSENENDAAKDGKCRSHAFKIRQGYAFVKGSLKMAGIESSFSKSPNRMLKKSRLTAVVGAGLRPAPTGTLVLCESNPLSRSLSEKDENSHDLSISSVPRFR